MIPLTDKGLMRMVVRRAELEFDRLMRAPELRDYDPKKSCLFWAAAILLACRQNPLLKYMQLQGGSASWRVVRPEDDDGVMPTHYSYVYTPGLHYFSLQPNGNFKCQECGYLTTEPAEDQNGCLGLGIGEVHYWTAIAPHHDPAGRGMIVDLTTKYVPDLARERGMRVSCFPPNLVWAYLDDMPENAHEYKPTLEATVTGSRLLEYIIKERV